MEGHSESKNIGCNQSPDYASSYHQQQNSIKEEIPDDTETFGNQSQAFPIIEFSVDPLKDEKSNSDDETIKTEAKIDIKEEPFDVFITEIDKVSKDIFITKNAVGDNIKISNSPDYVQENDPFEDILVKEDPGFQIMHNIFEPHQLGDDDSLNSNNIKNESNKSGEAVNCPICDTKMKRFYNLRSHFSVHHPDFVQHCNSKFEGVHHQFSDALAYVIDGFKEGFSGFDFTIFKATGNTEKKDLKQLEVISTISNLNGKKDDGSLSVTDQEDQDICWIEGPIQPSTSSSSDVMPCPEGNLQNCTPRYSLDADMLKLQTCPICQEKFINLKRHLLSGKHKLSREEADHLIPKASRRKTYKPKKIKSKRYRYCPLDECVGNPPFLRLDSHILHFHKLNKDHEIYKKIHRCFK